MKAVWKGDWQKGFSDQIDMGAAHVQSIHNLQVRFIQGYCQDFETGGAKIA